LGRTQLKTDKKKWNLYGGNGIEGGVRRQALKRTDSKAGGGTLKKRGNKRLGAKQEHGKKGGGEKHPKRHFDTVKSE